MAKTPRSTATAWSTALPGGELIGVCTADANATSVPEGIQAAGAEGGQGRFVGLVGKSTAHNQYLRVIRMNIRYGKSPLPRFRRIPVVGFEDFVLSVPPYLSSTPGGGWNTPR